MFRGANKQKHVFKKNPKALIWGKPPKVVGGKLLASGYWYDKKKKKKHIYATFVTLQSLTSEITEFTSDNVLRKVSE